MHFWVQMLADLGLAGSLTFSALILLWQTNKQRQETPFSSKLHQGA